MNPINTALFSFGMSGKIFHAPFIANNPHFNLYAVWERSKNLAEEIYPKIKTYRTQEDMLADDSIELVIVNTPNTTHFEYVKRSLEAGKNVIVEKPFTVTVKEGEELIEMAKKQNKVLSVYQNRRYDSDYKTIKKIIDGKWLGNIVDVEMRFDRYSEALSPKQHKEIPGTGKGSFYDLGSHLIDQSLQLFGMPQKVFADIHIVRPISKVDDYFNVLLYYPEMRVQLKSSYLVREPLPGYALHGSEGSFIKAKTNVQEELLKAGNIPSAEDWGTEPESERGLLHTEKNGKVIKEFITSEKGNYGEYYDGIYEAIKYKKSLPVTAEEGLDVIKIIEAAYKSNEEKCVAKL